MFSHYRVEVSDLSDNLLRTEEPIYDRQYVYTFEKNKADHGGTPSRSFKVTLYKVDDNGNASEPRTKTFTNPAPLAPASLNLTRVPGGLKVKPTASSESDVAGLQIWMDRSDATPQTLIYEGRDTEVVLPVDLNGTYYVQAAYYDSFGKTDLNLSAIESIAVSDIPVEDTTPPVDPTGLQTLDLFSAVQLSWTNPADADLNRIEIWSSDDNVLGNAVMVSTAFAPSDQQIVSGLTPLAAKYFWIRAVDNSGNNSGFVGPVMETPRQAISDEIADGVVNTAKFASGLTPVEIVSSLPTTGNFDGRQVYLTTDKKLYRYDGTQWTSAIPAADVGSGYNFNDLIVPDGAIGLTKLANTIQSEIARVSEIGKSVIAPGINAGAQGDTRFHKNETNNGEIRPSNVADDGGEIYFNHPTLGKTVIPPNEITTPWEGGNQPYGNRFYLVWSQADRVARGLDGHGGNLFTLEYNDETETWTAWGNTNSATFTPAPTDVVIAIGEKDAGASQITALRSLVGNETPVIQRVDTLENEVGSDGQAGTIKGRITGTETILTGVDGLSGLVKQTDDLELVVQGADGNSGLVGSVSNHETILQTNDGSGTGLVQRVADAFLEIGDDQTGTSIKGRIKSQEDIVGDASGGLVKRTTDVENQLNTPTTGVLARLGQTETALTDGSDPDSLVSIAQRVSTTEAGLTGGGNLAPNSRFIDGKGSNGYPRGWALSWDEAGTGRVDVGVNIHAGPEWYLDGDDGTLVMRDLGGPVAGSGRFDIRMVPNYPVSEGDRYVWSLYVGPHRCYVQLLIRWIAADNSTISYSSSAQYPGPQNGGDHLGGYYRAYAIGDAPAGAVEAEVRVRKGETNDGETSSFVFAVRPQFEEVPAGQNHPSPWSEGTDGANNLARTAIVEEALFDGAESRARIMFLAESNGRIASSWLTSTTSPNGTTATGIGFDSDVFRIWNGTSADPAFQVIGGNVYLRNNLIVDGAITTSKLAAGAVTADQVAASAITTSKLAVTAQHDFLTADPSFQDPELWNEGNASVLTNRNDGYRGRNYLRTTAYEYYIDNGQSYTTYPVDENETYDLEMVLRRLAGDGDFYAIIRFQDGNGNDLTASGWPSFHGNNYYPTGMANATPGTSWTRYVSRFGAGTNQPIPAGAKTFRIGALLNYQQTVTGAMDVGFWGVRRAVDAELLVDGSVIADKLASNSVTTEKLFASAITGEKINAATAINVGTGGSLGNGLFDRAGMWGQGNTSNPVRFFAGHTSPVQAPFQVDQEGAIRARRLTILTEDGGAVWFDTETGFSELARTQILAQSSPRTDKLAETLTANSTVVAFALVENKSITGRVKVNKSGLSVTQTWPNGSSEPADAFPSSLTLDIQTRPQGGTWTSRQSKTYTKITSGTPTATQYLVSVTTQEPYVYDDPEFGVPDYEFPGYKTETVTDPNELISEFVNTFTGDSDGETYEVRAVLTNTGAPLNFETKTRVIELEAPGKDFVLDLTTVQGEGNANTLDGIDSSGFWRKSELTTPLDVGTNGQLPNRTVSSANDTVTNYPFAMQADSHIGFRSGSYLRRLIGTQAGELEIGQAGTAIITGINLLPGASGTAKVNGAKIATESWSFGRFVRSDGINGGYTDIVVNDTDFIVRDSTDGMTNFIWRDHSASKLMLGTNSAAVEFRGPLPLWSGETMATRTWVNSQGFLTSVPNHDASKVTSGVFNVARTAPSLRDTNHPGNHAVSAPREGVTVWLTSTDANYPFQYAAILSARESVNRQFQLAVGNNADFYFRRGHSSGWESWQKVWHDGNFTPTSQPASNITSGTFSTARIPNLDAGKITSGELNRWRLPQIMSQDRTVTFRTDAGETMSGTTSGSIRALEIEQTDSTGDALMLFHINGKYAAYFGLEAASNDLVYGGWSAGGTPRRVLHMGNASSLLNLGQYAVKSSNVTFTSVTTTGNMTVNGGEIDIREGSPQLRFTDTSSGAADFWWHVNSNSMYLLTNYDGVGNWSGPHPAQFRNAQQDLLIYGNRAWDAGNFDPNTKLSTSGGTISGGLNVTGSLTHGSGARRTFWGHNNDRSYMAPRLSDNTNWNWGREFGFNWNDNRWYVDGPLFAGQLDTSGNANVSGDVVTRRMRTNNGQELVLCAGESSSLEAGQLGNERVYAVAENGFEVISSPDNWASGWAGRNASAVINDANGNSSLPGQLNTAGSIITKGDYLGNQYNDNTQPETALPSTWVDGHYITPLHTAKTNGYPVNYGTLLTAKDGQGNAATQIAMSWHNQDINSPLWFRANRDGDNSWSHIPWQQILTMRDNGYVYINGKEVFRTSDTYLRFNNSGEFTSGIYCGNSKVRTDGEFTLNDDRYLRDGVNVTWRLQNSSGYVDIGTQNSSYAHYSTDRPGHYFNKKVHASGGFEVYASGGTRLDSSGLNLANGDIINFGSSTGVRTLMQLEGRPIVRQISDRGGVTWASADDTAIYGGGDVAHNFHTYINPASEATYLVSDNNVIIVTELQGGYSTSNQITFASGGITAAGNITQTSDGRLKKDIADLRRFDLSKFKARTYRWAESGKDDWGGIAQEFLEWAPEAVHEDANGQLSLSYAKLSIIALQELKYERKRNDELEARLERLEALV